MLADTLLTLLALTSLDMDKHLVDGQERDAMLGLGSESSPVQFRGSQR